MPRKAVFHDSGTYDDGGSPLTLGGVSSINKTGSSALTGAVTLTGGTNVTLTQAGQDISIASTGGGGGVTKLYDYEVSGSDKASIDTNVDGTTVANFAGYDVLEVFAILRTDDAVNPLVIPVMVVNNDTSSIYDREVLRAADTTVLGANALAGASWAFQTHGSAGLSGQPGLMYVQIPAYASTVFNKIGTLETRVTDSTAANNLVESWAVGYRSTSAITRVKLAAPGATKFKVGSRLMVYGR